MRDLRELNRYRFPASVEYGSATYDDRYSGRFTMKYKNEMLIVIASNDMGWDHVSVSLKHRSPKWDEMEVVKRLFFEKNELCWQYHVPVEDHINIHPYVLHIWRKHDFEMPVPPRIMV